MNRSVNANHERVAKLRPYLSTHRSGLRSALRFSSCRCDSSYSVSEKARIDESDALSVKIGDFTASSVMWQKEHRGVSAEFDDCIPGPWKILTNARLDDMDYRRSSKMANTISNTTQTQHVTLHPGNGGSQTSWGEIKGRRPEGHRSYKCRRSASYKGGCQKAVK
jgi:hypothetical protein